MIGAQCANLPPPLPLIAIDCLRLPTVAINFASKSEFHTSRTEVRAAHREVAPRQPLAATARCGRIAVMR
jgi:hypothetical protein